jgi:bacteriocin biosynthesis cyclodehydratase domain-containing protein
MQPLLLPGTRVLRRDADHLQVGLDPATRVVLPDSPALRRLESGEALRGGDALLHRLGPVLLPDDAPLRSALPAAARSSYADGTAWSRHSLASLARRGRADAATLARRASYVVVVQCPPARRSPPGLADALAEELRVLCRRSGLRTADGLPGGPRAHRPPVVRVLVCIGEPDRRLVDAWTEPHLLVRFVEGDGVVGPFVEPGATACVRCADAHLAERDPVWPLLVEQYARLGDADRADGMPEPVDAALAAVCLAWAVRDLTTYLEGGRPVSSGRSLRITPSLVEVESQDWPRRPDCGCAGD